MKYRIKWYWKVGIPLMVLLLSMGFVLFWGGGGGSGVVETIYYRFTPMVVNESFPTDVVLEVKVAGSPTEVKIALESTGGARFS